MSDSTVELHDGLILPVMTLREVVLFPRSIVPLFVGRGASIKAIESALQSYDKKIFLVTQKDAQLENPTAQDVFETGTVCNILQMLRLPDKTIKILFEGLYRASCKKEELELDPETISHVQVYQLPETEENNAESQALIRATQEAVEEYGRINQKITRESILAMSTIGTPGRLADAVIPHLKIDFLKKQNVLEELDGDKRLELVFSLLQGEIEIFSLEKKIKSRVKKQMNQNQKDYYLGEQLKAIHKEMGRDADTKSELDELETRLKEKDMPEEAREKGLAEIKKMRQMPPSSAEYTVLSNYIDWVLALPWNTIIKAEIDIKKAKKILNAEHYGLEKPKERILEYLAVQSLVNKVRGPILCLVGPPGVGKTSLSKSIANATGREFVRLALGGVRDEAEIRGHRRTYVGALPGKIIKAIKRIKSNNPVFCLDEVDKMSTDFRGDPSSALLEVLDPEQNVAFSDHYLDLDYDLSNIFFITTANSLSSIPLPLRDRMEIIELSGYLETEKMQIARNYLVPKQLELNGLAAENISVSDGAVLQIIRHYTREAGVRNLERQIASICRKVARRVVEKKDKADQKIRVVKNSVDSYLGIPKVRHGEKEESSQIGVCSGLAWTQFGGEILLVESVLMPGSGKIEITGKLGEVMQESAKAALSYIRSRSDIFGLRETFHKEIDIHIHVPEGATPKDGPSAGITLATSIVSALLALPVSNDLAMTGEITLRGRVLPIGGLREKLLAAKRANIHTVLVPADNEKDLKEIPDSVLRGLDVVLVQHMDDVLPRALGGVSPEVLFCGRDDYIPLAGKLMKDEYRQPEQ